MRDLQKEDGKYSGYTKLFLNRLTTNIYQAEEFVTPMERRGESEDETNMKCSDVAMGIQKHRTTSSIGPVITVIQFIV